MSCALDTDVRKRRGSNPQATRADSLATSFLTIRIASMSQLPFSDSHRSRPAAMPWLLFRALAQGTPLSGERGGRTHKPFGQPASNGCPHHSDALQKDWWRDRHFLHRVRMSHHSHHRHAHRRRHDTVRAQQRQVQRQDRTVGGVRSVRRDRGVVPAPVPAVSVPGRSRTRIHALGKRCSVH